MIKTKFSQREQLMVALTIAIVVLTLAYGFIIEPIASGYATLSAKIESGRLRLEKSRKLLANAEKIRREYDQFSKYIRKTMSDEEEMAATLKTIESLARSNNLSISNIRPQPLREEGGFRFYVFDVSCESDLARLSKFIYDTQTSEALMRVTRLTISAPSQTRSSVPRVLMEITRPSLK